jgi:hypothetical protein
LATPAVAKLMKAARFGLTLPSAEPSVRAPVPTVAVDMPTRSNAVAISVTSDQNGE